MHIFCPLQLKPLWNYCFPLRIGGLRPRSPSGYAYSWSLAEDRPTTL